MGMGDKKAPYRPPSLMKRCDVTKRDFYYLEIRECHEPNVVKRFGHNGKCNVNLYICNKCHFAKHYSNFGGISCDKGDSITLDKYFTERNK